MDLISPIIDIFSRLWDCTSEQRGYICHFQQNLQELKFAFSGLQAKERIKRIRIEREESRDYGLRRTPEVESWLNEVNIISGQVEELMRRGDEEIRNTCLGNCCPRNCVSRYRLGKQISIMTTTVQGLTSTLLTVDVTERVPRAAVDEMPMEETVGLDSTFTQIWSCFQDGSITQTLIIGLYGMGGVGKTTLLKKLNNTFLQEGRTFYNVVIWVVVSREVSLWKIQEVIREKLEISDGIWKDKVDEHARSVEIFRALKEICFLLLLDDVWEPINLVSLGVPLDNNNGSKIVFTTRQEHVCGLMSAHKRFKVDCLSPEASMNLFRKKVGEDVLNSHPDISKLADLAVEECKGLPLALVIVGGAMANWKTPDDWRREVKVLQSCPFYIAGMDDLVFHRLRYSYDSLKDETLRNCFLYCSIFPEDHNIMKDELIELWIGEGFLDEYGNIYDMRNYGESVIGKLLHLSLLEHGEYKSVVTMHDLLHDMALKIAHEEKNKILVQQRNGLIEPLEFHRWRDVKRVSLWGPNIEFFGEAPFCPDLRTFLVRNTKLKKFPDSFFKSMKALKVLDLSYNKTLSKLPGSISYLVSLHHLNMSYTDLKVLPIELKILRQLKVLIIDFTENLEGIPTGLISSLSSLEVFSRLVATKASALHDDQDLAILEELERLNKLRDISLTLSTFRSVIKLKVSSKLQCCIKRLTIMSSELEILDISSPIMKRMAHLDTLSIRNCLSLRELKISLEEQGGMQSLVRDCFHTLCYLQIENCPIKDLKLLRHSPNLRFLWVDSCSLLEDIVVEDFGSAEIEESIDMLSKLERINLVRLPNLKSISPRAMLFPCLKDVEVIDCPKLRKLPFNSDTAKNVLNVIKGSKQWWDQLEWDDAATKYVFSPKFMESDFALFKSIMQPVYTKKQLRFK